VVTVATASPYVTTASADVTTASANFLLLVLMLLLYAVLLKQSIQVDMTERAESKKHNNGIGRCKQNMSLS